MGSTIVWRRWHLSLIARIVVLAFLGVMAGREISAHGGSVVDGLIHSSVNNHSDEVKLTDAGDSCKKNWTAVDWNARALMAQEGPVPMYLHRDRVSP